MSNVQANSRAEESTIELVITHTDGTVEYRTVYWHRNPFKRLAWRVKSFLKGK